MSDKLVVPGRIKKAIEKLEKTKKPGERVRSWEMGGANINWLLELGIVKISTPDRRSYTHTKNAPIVSSRENPEHNEYEYVGAVKE